MLFIIVYSSCSEHFYKNICTHNVSPSGEHLEETGMSKRAYAEPFVVQQLTNPTSIHEDAGLIPGSVG